MLEVRCSTFDPRERPRGRRKSGAALSLAPHSMRARRRGRIRHSDFVIPSGLGISSFVICKGRRRGETEALTGLTTNKGQALRRRAHHDGACPRRVMIDQPENAPKTPRPHRPCVGGANDCSGRQSSLRRGRPCGGGRVSRTRFWPAIVAPQGQALRRRTFPCRRMGSPDPDAPRPQEKRRGALACAALHARTSARQNSSFGFRHSFGLWYFVVRHFPFPLRPRRTGEIRNSAISRFRSSGG